MVSRKAVVEQGSIEHDGPLSRVRVKRAATHTPPQERLSWPRSDSDGTPLGVDITAKYLDIVRLSAKCLGSAPAKRFLRGRIGSGCRGREMTVEDFIQEVLLTLHRRNTSPSAFDPRRAQLSTYIYQVCWTTLDHLTKRMDQSRLTPLGEVFAKETLATDLDSDVCCNIDEEEDEVA